MSKYLCKTMAAASCFTLTLVVSPATAQTTSTTVTDLSSSISCLKGKVPPNDYTEIGQNLRETGWDQSGGVAMEASTGGLKLRVLDPYGNSVCADEANNTASCRFKVNLGLISEFTILVVNDEAQETIDYKICAF